MSVKYGLEGQVAIITGAANGFGLAVANRLADEGAKLVLVDRDEQALRAAAEKLGGLAVDPRMARDPTAQIDPSDPEGVFRAVSDSVPYGKRYGTAAEVANLVMWLLSDESEYVSGALHLIDGGLNAG